MARHLPSLLALRAFEAAGRHGSFSKAADELFVTQSAISHRIRLLERHIGQILFKRLGRGVELTRSGAEYLAGVTASFDQLEDATRRIKIDRARTLSVNAPPSFAMLWLASHLPSFAMQHPLLDVRLTTSWQIVDFSRDEIDVAIRIGARYAPHDGIVSVSGQPLVTGGALDAVELAQETLLAVCSPQLLQRLSNPRDLRNQVALCTSTRPEIWTTWLDAVGVSQLGPVETKTFGHFFLTIEAALNSLGIAVVPIHLVIRELASGTLVALFDEGVPSNATYYLVSRVEKTPNGDVQLFRDWLMAEVKKQEHFWRA
jgi:LysR family transcriptional regulator, glycine cleavage system transcriptional activator